jgi:hypothetical protein
MNFHDRPLTGSIKPLFQFNKPITMVLRGPMNVHAVGVFTKVAGTANDWQQTASAGAITWK